MELIDFSKNKDSISKQLNIESVLLYGNPDEISDASITICIPTYKRPKLLNEAITSAVNQKTSIPYKITIVDNDFDFDNMEVYNIIKSFNQKKISYYKNKENLLSMGNLNRCIVIAKTKWAALLHDDDLLLDNYIEEISKILLKYGNKIKAITVKRSDINNPYYSNIVLSTKKKKLYNYFLNIKNKYFDNHFLLKRIHLAANIFGNVYYAPTCGLLFDRKTFIESGGFDPNYSPSADWFFLIYFSQKYSFYRLRKILGIYRWDDNASLKKEVKDATALQRDCCLFSLKKQSVFIFVLMFFFKEEINRKKHTIWFRLLKHILSF